MIILRNKIFGEIGMIGGLGVGAVGGAYLGNHIHAKVDQHKAKKNYDPEEEASKLEKEADESEKKAAKLEKDKKYMSTVKSARKDRDSKISNTKENWDSEDESFADSAEEEFDRKASKGDPKRLREDAADNRRKAAEIRKDPKAAKEKAGREAYQNRKLNGGAGQKIGAIGGMILGAGLGTRSKY